MHVTAGELNPGTRVPENPGNLPVFQTCKPGFVCIQNPGFDGFNFGLRTGRKSVQKQRESLNMRQKAEKNKVLTELCTMSERMNHNNNSLNHLNPHF
jgi:hypothetical protein